MLLPLQILENMRDWARRTIEFTGVDKIFVFGSLVQDNGSQFDATTSDIDLITVLKRNETLYARIQILKKLQQSMEELELLLLKMLKRRDASQSIVSNVVVTPTELEYSIHKSGDRLLLSLPRFVDLAASELALQSLSSGEDEAHFISKNSDQLAIIRTCQDKRNKFVSISVNGSRIFSAFDGLDAIPKDIMRMAAILVWNRGESTDDRREDLIEGMSFFQRLLDELAPKDFLTEEVRNVVARRRADRGVRPSIPDDYLLALYEIVFDEAIAQIEPSLRKRIDDFISNVESNSQK
jgi:predicted nucleotidyltransferase